MPAFDVSIVKIGYTLFDRGGEAEFIVYSICDMDLIETFTH